MIKRLDQRQLVQSLSQKELYLNLYLTQAIFLILTVVVSFISNQNYTEWINLIQFQWSTILLWSIPTALAVVILDLFLWRFAPYRWIDDGGINERIFADISFLHLLFLTAVIGTTEELLFRGALQVNIGYIPASLLFAVMHIRYITKPLLLMVAIIFSFLLGGIFLQTGNLFIPICIHFLIDFLLGLILKYDLFALHKGFSQGIDRGDDAEKGD